MTFPSSLRKRLVKALVALKDAISYCIKKIEDAHMVIPESYRQPKPDVDEKDFWVDEDKFPPGLLLSDRIEYYAKKVNLIYPFEREFVEAASYTLHAGTEYILGDRYGNLEKEISVVIPPNGMIYIRFFEEVNLPHYVIARFNLRVKLVYQGLLLGTGPQVDPGFRGNLGCPIHNFSDQPYRIWFFDPLVTIDFEKTTPFGQITLLNKTNGLASTPPFDEYRRGTQPVVGIDNLPCKIYNKKQNRPLKDYLPNGQSVSSSVYKLNREVTRLKRYAVVGGLGVVIGGVTLVLMLYMNLETNYNMLYGNLENTLSSRITGLDGEIKQLMESVGLLKGARDVKQDSGKSRSGVRYSTEIPAPLKPSPPKDQTRAIGEKRAP